MDRVEKIIKSVLPTADVKKEFRFCKDRRWRVDYAVFYNDKKIAIEIEGGAWVFGRHNRPSGFIKDIEKYNTLSSMGWTLIRIIPNKESLLVKFLLLIKSGGSYEKENKS